MPTERQSPHVALACSGGARRSSEGDSSAQLGLVLPCCQPRQCLLECLSKLIAKQGMPCSSADVVPHTSIQNGTFVEEIGSTYPAVLGETLNKGLAVSQGRRKGECLSNPVRRKVGFNQHARRLRRCLLVLRLCRRGQCGHGHSEGLSIQVLVAEDLLQQGAGCSATTYR